MKSHLREQFLTLRKTLSRERREQASSLVISFLETFLTRYTHVLSFMPIGSEIDIVPLNCALARENKLILPKVEETHLKLYAISDLSSQIAPSPHIQEPIPALCPEIDPAMLSCILVPAVAFDPQHNRLGYGKGYYDRLLKGLSAYKIGLGFKEQLAEALPQEPHDISVDFLLLR